MMNSPSKPEAPAQRPRAKRWALTGSLVLSAVSTSIAMIAPHYPAYLNPLVIIGFPGIVIASFLPVWPNSDIVFFLYALVINSCIYYLLAIGLYRLWRLFGG